jgi:hypothetical protein
MSDCTAEVQTFIIICVALSYVGGMALGYVLCEQVHKRHRSQ